MGSEEISIFARISINHEDTVPLCFMKMVFFVLFVVPKNT